jgi:hypothetical protein
MSTLKVCGHETVYRDGEYVSFPNIARLADGTVMCAFRHAKERQKELGRVTHIDPTAKAVYLLSQDGGVHFDQTLHTLYNDEMSEQDPCISVLRDGRVIVTYFRWQLVPAGQGANVFGAERFARFGRTIFDNTYDTCRAGIAYSISDDNGATWRHMPTIDVEGLPVSGGSVRGNIIELPDGGLLLPVYGPRLQGNELSRSVLLRSDDRGETFYYYSCIAFDESCQKNYFEPNLFRTQSGRIVALLRTETDVHAPDAATKDTYLDLHIAVSDDDGKTFGPAQPVEGVYGSNPFYALQLASGHVLVVYGYRRAPYGIRAKLCSAELTDLAQAPEIVLRDDAPNGDLGYPHAIQLEDGRILVVYYIATADGIRQIDATWLLEEDDAADT